MSTRITTWIFPALALAALGLSGCNGSGKAKDPDQIAADRESKARIAEKFEESLFGELVPTADGGAYAVSYSGSLWYLREGKAVRVKESPESVAMDIPARERWLWAMLTHERQLGKRKAKQAVEDYQADLEADAQAEAEANQDRY